MLPGRGLKTHKIKTNKITKKTIKDNTERKIITSNSTQTKDKMVIYKSSRTTRILEINKSIKKRGRISKIQTIILIEIQHFHNPKVVLQMIIRIRKKFLKKLESLFLDNRASWRTVSHPIINTIQTSMISTIKTTAIQTIFNKITAFMVSRILLTTPICPKTMLQLMRDIIKTMTTRWTNKRNLRTKTTTKWLIVVNKASHPLTLNSNDHLVNSILVSKLTITRC